jgi:acyl-coenzyme A synthetase/AMP-(fatty) acid ligase
LDADAALSMVELHRIDIAVTSAAQAAQLAAAKKAKPGYRTDSLKTIFIGGGKLDPSAVADIRSLLCRDLIHQYGSTEAGVVAAVPFHRVDDQPAVVPLPWAEIQIVDQAGQLLAPGTEGLIRYRTPQLTENIKSAGGEGVVGVRGGWFYPGDLGTLSVDGVLHFTGRISDVINRGGVKVSGTRVEEILRELPNVKDAAACSILGASGLEELWVAVVPNGPIEKDEIEQALANHADVGLAPDEVFLLSEFPVGELGKVQKSRLKELLLERKRAV